MNAPEHVQNSGGAVDRGRDIGGCAVQFMGSGREECLVAGCGSRLVVLDSSNGEELSALPLGPAACDPHSP